MIFSTDILNGWWTSIRKNYGYYLYGKDGGYSFEHFKPIYLVGTIMLITLIYLYYPNSKVDNKLSSKVKHTYVNNNYTDGPLSYKGTSKFICKLKYLNMKGLEDIDVDVQSMDLLREILNYYSQILLPTKDPKSLRFYGNEEDTLCGSTSGKVDGRDVKAIVKSQEIRYHNDKLRKIKHKSLLFYLLSSAESADYRLSYEGNYKDESQIRSAIAQLSWIHGIYGILSEDRKDRKIPDSILSRFDMFKAKLTEILPQSVPGKRDQLAESVPIFSEEISREIKYVSFKVPGKESDGDTERFPLEYQHLYLMQTIRYGCAMNVTNPTDNIYNNGFNYMGSEFHGSENGLLCMGNHPKDEEYNKKIQDIKYKCNQELCKHYNGLVSLEVSANGTDYVLGYGGSKNTNDENAVKNIGLFNRQIDMMFEFGSIFYRRIEGNKVGFERFVEDRSMENLINSVKLTMGIYLKGFGVRDEDTVDLEKDIVESNKDGKDDSPEIPGFNDEILLSKRYLYFSDTDDPKPLDDKDRHTKLSYQYIHLMTELIDGSRNRCSNNDITQPSYHWEKGILKRGHDPENKDLNLSIQKVGDLSKYHQFLVGHNEVESNGSILTRLSYTGETKGDRESIGRDIGIFEEQIDKLSMMINLYCANVKGKDDDPIELLGLLDRFKVWPSSRYLDGTKVNDVPANLGIGTVPDIRNIVTDKPSEVPTGRIESTGNESNARDKMDELLRVYADNDASLM